jgi:hypothetical protein
MHYTCEIFLIALIVAKLLKLNALFKLLKLNALFMGELVMAQRSLWGLMSGFKSDSPHNQRYTVYCFLYILFMLSSGIECNEVLLVQI